MAKTITFVQPPSSISDLSTTVQSGGSLTASTTYYYVVVPIRGNLYEYSSFQAQGGISNEVSASTDASNKTIRLDWTAPANADGYYVFRGTSSDDWGYARVYPSTGSSYYVTTTNNYFIDDGSWSTTSSYMPSTVSADNPILDLFDLRTNGLGYFSAFSGGTSGDPITLEDIYDASVTDGWDTWCSYNGMQFLYAGTWYTSTSTETHFSAKYCDLYLFGFVYWNLYNTNSSMKFGELLSNGGTNAGCKINVLGSRNAEFRPGGGVYLYDTFAQGCNDTSHVYYEAGIIVTQYSNMYSVKAVKNCTWEGFSNCFCRSDAPVNGLTMTPYWANVTNTLKLHSNITTHSYISIYYGENPRADRINTLYASYSVRWNSSYGTPATLHKQIDCDHPNSTDSEKFPIVSWSHHTDNERLWVLASMILKVVDENGTTVSGAKVQIYDTNGTLQKDHDDIDCEFTTDSEGMIWREKITTTAVTLSTLTDSSKSWTTDEWKGRNVYIVNGDGARQQVKIKSNTATVLTLTEDLVTALTVGDLAGIKAEVRYGLLQHKVGTADGRGDNYTTITRYNPHSIVISKQGYETLRVPITIKAGMELTYKLSQSASTGRDSMGKVFR